MNLILNFNEIDKSALPTVGGKNASLGEMIKSGIRVPPGFAVTTDAYRLILREKAEGTAVLMASHDPELFERVSDARLEIGS